MRHQLLYPSLHLPMANHPRQQRMYSIMRRNNCRPNMAQYLYHTVFPRHSFVKTGSLFKQTSPPTIPDKSTIGIYCSGALGPLPLTTKGNECVVLISDGYYKLNSAIPTVQITLTHVAYIFLDDWTIPYPIPTCILANSTTQFIWKFLATLCMHLGPKAVGVNWLSRTNRCQVNRYKLTIIVCFPNYVWRNQRDCDTFVQS